MFRDLPTVPELLRVAAGRNAHRTALQKRDAIDPAPLAIDRHQVPERVGNAIFHSLNNNNCFVGEPHHCSHQLSIYPPSRHKGNPGFEEPVCPADFQRIPRDMKGLSGQSFAWFENVVLIRQPLER